jgi:hypothetical protein
MFFFETIPWYNWVMWFVVLGALLGLNEIIRASKLGSIAIFMVLPVLLTPVWFMMESEITSWFTWIKVYSALAGSIIYMVIRFTDYHKKHPWYLILVPGILAINILEAVIREFQVGILGFQGMVDGMQYISGGWIIAYGVWNIAYVYSCAPGNAFYSGVALNISATIPALFWAKGTWMQNRAATLSFWMMWVMTMPYFFAIGSTFNVSVSYNPAANWSIAILSLALNLVLAVWQVYRIVKNRLNPLKDEIYTDLPEYKQVNSLR